MLKSIHIKAFIAWAIYAIFTKGVFLYGVSKSTPAIVAFSVNILFSAFFAIIFLYIFSHEDFFKFGREIEKKNLKKEKKWLDRLKHHGKIATATLIGMLGGPLFAALTLRLLLPRLPSKYILVGAIAVLSAALALAIGRGITILSLISK